MKRALLPVLTMLSACATVAAVPPQGSTVAFGETIRLVDLTVTPRAVIEDSRCPADVTCIWAGRVVLRADVRDGSGPRSMELTLGVPVRIGEGMLALSEVSPTRDSRSDIAPSDYRFRFTYGGLE